MVAALHGRVFDRGIELMLHCDRNVAVLETRFGVSTVHSAALAGQAFAARAAATADGYPLAPFLRPFFDWLLHRAPADNALAARRCALLTTADQIIMQPRQLVQVASATATALAEAGYRPPPQHLLHRLPNPIECAELKALLDERLATGSISPPEHRYGLALTAALCTAPPAADGEPATAAA